MSFNFIVNNLFLKLFELSSRERIFKATDLIQNNSKSPHVWFFPVFLTFPNLRSQVVRSSNSWRVILIFKTLRCWSLFLRFLLNRLFFRAYVRSWFPLVLISQDIEIPWSQSHKIIIHFSAVKWIWFHRHLMLESQTDIQRHVYIYIHRLFGLLFDVWLSSLIFLFWLLLNL